MVDGRPTSAAKNHHHSFGASFLLRKNNLCHNLSTTIGALDMPSDKILTAGELLRRRAEKTRGLSSSSDERSDTDVQHTGDIDDQIRRLEAELAKDYDESSVDSDESSSSSSDGNDNPKGDESEGKQGVLRLSSLEKEAIAGLPKHMLPAARKRPLKIDDELIEKKVSKKVKEKADSGLALAVKEVLSGYVARSSEKLPFYCRYCQKQYQNEQEFFSHKQTDFHKTAVEMERKASYCKLCRKQLTSPEQLKEHLQSRPHKERLEHVRSRNPSGRGRGHGNAQRGRGWRR